MRFGMGYDAWTGGPGLGGERGGRGGGRQGAHHHHGRRRLFDGGELRLVLLKLIAESPRHGYDLIRALEERTGGAYAPSPGVVYPSLTMLGDMGLIEERPGPASRKAFAVTAEGEANLAANAEVLAALTERIEALASRQRRTDGAPIRRAMHNLRAVLEHRLGREDADDAVLLEAAAIIDAAAQKIERL
ncbi:PadR family transcriptional regulator [Sphingomonas jatrophae]|uniref:Transcriptional regulator, PadR family n=1 Tax=Sphingomonas jatrophae TaxID=1166337 RepID=A0A1I6JEG9_9SPHN|nr:PadR family transcriptional regulator [Sphingomonas jatrophae]SFR77415.1 transcriptional regulator, PadR family [Sphingomonas jatrophae]